MTRLAALPTVVAGLAFALAPESLVGQVAQTPVDGVDLFETEVRPLLERHCFKCHGADPERLRGDLALTERSGLLRGGARGPALDIGEPDASLVLEAVSYENDQLEMPPSGPLGTEDVELLRQWVRLGAPFGDDEDGMAAAFEGTDEGFRIRPEDREWWSHRPLEQPDPPRVEEEEWPLHDLDRFVLARLEAADLGPAPEADRRTLLRRAKYDLLGLPATAEEIVAFEADERPDAWERVIDGYLASPHYGERWGRHWLDLVRYAETDGYERDRLKPGAWRYRDWVIDAFNADMPYDEFLVHQLAGDEIEGSDIDSLIATGYLRLGIWDDEPTDTALAQYDDLDSILDTTSRVMLGISMGCARCHDHRGDPLPQRDYYRMLSFFRGIAPYKVGGGNQPTPAHYVDRVPEDFGDPQREIEIAAWWSERQASVDEAKAIVAGAVEDIGDEALRRALEDRDAGLVAHLSLDETEPLVAVDERGRHHGRIADATVGVEGVHGTAFELDGNDDAIRLPRPVADDFTISAWFRSDDTSPAGDELSWVASQAIIDANSAGEKNDFGLGLVAGGYVVAGTGAPTRSVHSAPGYNDGEWHHAVFVRERSSGALRLFVDGEPEAEGEGSTARLDDAPLVEIGARATGDFHFAGAVDDVRFYDRVLSHREVLDLYLGGATSEPVLDMVRRSSRRDGIRLESLADRLLTRRAPRRGYIEILRVKEFGPVPPPTHVLIRGNPHAPAEAVEPGFPEILDERPPGLTPPDPDAPTSGRRLALARWIADDTNLRTSRVMANRLWQYHFGRGLSPSPNDFGRFGSEPTHPRLLDWLATELVDRDWSLKSMHRLLMTSRTYRMSSRGSEEALADDPENQLFWRYDMRRLTAEEIRDSILAANGTLNLETGGPSVYPPMPREVLETASRPDAAWGEATPEEAARRSVYIHVKRSLLHPLLETLDLADTDATCPVRFTTTQPTQALTLLNSGFMQEQAKLLAARVVGEVGEESERRVSRALEIVAARNPTGREVDRGLALLDELVREEGFTPATAFASYCLLLLNLNEFVYVD